MIGSISSRLPLRLGRCTSGVALIEFAIGLPVFLTLTLTGAETANWIITKMRVSQLALQLADNSARMGDGSLLQAKTISETDINDVLTGAGLQSGELDIYNNGRVIISDVEPMPDPNPNNKDYIKWQRCRGTNNHASQYGNVSPLLPITNTPTQPIDGMGPAGRLVQAQPGNATMFVEVYYKYQPLISSKLVANTDLDEIASMAVRDRRDLTQIYNSENAPKSTCDKFTAT